MTAIAELSDRNRAMPTAHRYQSTSHAHKAGPAPTIAAAVACVDRLRSFLDSESGALAGVSAD